LGTILPFDFLLTSAAWLMRACNSLLEGLSTLPQASWQQHAPPLWATLAAGAGVLWLLAPRGIPARWLGLLVMLPLFTAVPARPQAGELWLDVLDVGQGHAAVVRTARHALLFDAGPRFTSESDSGSRVIVPFLRGSGVVALDGVVVSHADTDHSGGLLSVLQAMPVGWVATSVPLDEPALALAPVVRRCVRGEAWEWDGVRFSMLQPGLGSYAVAGLEDNNRSCVLHIAGAGGAVLLTADIEREAEHELLAQLPDNLRADVLVVPHHGSATSSTDALIARLHPREAIVPVGYRNRFGHPAAEVLLRYERMGIRVSRTDRDGAVQVRIAQAPALRTWRALRPRYWHPR
jgi:competence protein ComEC